MLSGFVIYHVHSKDFDAPSRLGPYAYKRAARIYPNLWLISLLLVPLFLAGLGEAGQAGGLTTYNLAASFLLLPQSAVPLIAVSWTLKYEAFFYVMFALAILRFRAGVALFIAWQLLVVALIVAGDPHLPLGIELYTRPICLEFGVGIGSALAVRRLSRSGMAQNRPLLRLILVAGIVLFLGCSSLDRLDISPVDWSCLSYAAASAIIITALVLLEGAGGFAPPAWLVALGGASYAIYLVHYSVIRAAVVVLAKLHLPVWSGLDMVAVSAAGILAGCVLYAGFDLPMQKLLRRKSAGVRIHTQPPSTLTVQPPHA